MSDAGLQFRVLGPLSAECAGHPVHLGGRKQRLALALLLMNPGRVVSSDRLIEALWGEEPPDRAMATLQVHISNLRRALAGGAPAIITQAPGYVLPTSAVNLDLLRFEELVALGQDRAAKHQPDEAHDLFATALDLWRGAALADLESEPYADSVRTFLEERRLGVEEDLIRVMLDLGRDRQALSRAEALLDGQPLRESLWEMSILALYRLGRQADALAAYRRCRGGLMDELGIDPMPRLRTLEQLILNQDESLELSPVGTATRGSGPSHGPDGDVTMRRPRGGRDAHLVLDDGSRFRLTDRVTLGRHPESDILLTDLAVSRRHAEIRSTNGGHILLDLSSSNGTWVAGEQVMQHLLQNGEVIGIGEHGLVYRMS